MQYSDTILTDDNFDYEIEKLAETIGIPHTNYDCFVEKLDDDFQVQTHDLGFEEWLRCKTLPNPSSDCMQAFQCGQLAYEFGNGFVIMNFDIIL